MRQPILPLVLRSGVTRSATLPWSVNFTALSIRFSSAARRRTGSPTANAGKLFGNIDRRFQALCRRAAGQRIAGIARQRAQVEKILPHLESGAAASRGVDKQRRKARQMFGARLDGVDPAPFALIEVGGREQIADGQDAGERRADLMRKGGQRGLDHAGNCGGGFALAARLHSGARIRAFSLAAFLLAV